MTTAVYLVAYAGVLIFLAGCLVRIIHYARLPVHLRWEIYPVPHEDPERAKHGGSYFEEPEWWTKPARFNLWGEIKAMLPEMLWLKAVWEFNRPLWWRSFCFHFGLYLLIFTALLVAATAAAWQLAPALLSEELLAVLHAVYTTTGWLGAIMVMLGAIGLLLRRLRDPSVRIYTAPGDLFNLVWFIVAVGLLLAAYLTRPQQAPSMLELARGLLAFDTALPLATTQAVALLVAAPLVAYIPWTHMSHFIGKYFTYHAVRWDDAPAAWARELERKIAQYLSYRPTWSAPHVMADGKRSWAEIALMNPARREVKQ